MSILSFIKTWTTIKSILFVLMISSSSDEPCEFGQEEFTIFLKVLESKKIIEKSDKEINIQLNNKLFFPMPEYVVIDMDTLKLSLNKVDIATINIVNVKEKDDKSLIIVFFINKLSRRYRGNINFRCQDNKLLFDDISYHSEID
jgi:hypothetical protein